MSEEIRMNHSNLPINKIDEIFSLIFYKSVTFISMTRHVTLKDEEDEREREGDKKIDPTA